MNFIHPLTISHTLRQNIRVQQFRLLFQNISQQCPTPEHDNVVKGRVGRVASNSKVAFFYGIRSPFRALSNHAYSKLASCAQPEQIQQSVKSRHATILKYRLLLNRSLQHPLFNTQRSFFFHVTRQMY